MPISPRGGAPVVGAVAGPATVSVTLTGTSQPQSGDVLIIIHGNDYFTTSAMPTPTVGGSTTGVNAIVTADGGTNFGHIKAYWYVVTSTGDLTVSVTETGLADEGKYLAVYVLSGADTTTVIDVSGSNFNSTGSGDLAPVAPSVSPTTSNGYLICATNSGGGANVTAYTPPSGMTEVYDANVGSEMGYSGAVLQLSASGATGTKTFTAANQTTWVAVSIVVLTASAAAPVDSTSVNYTFTPGLIAPSGVLDPGWDLGSTSAPIVNATVADDVVATATAYDAQTTLTATPADATATVTAYDATVSTSSSPTAADAAASAAAFDAQAGVGPTAVDAAVAATAYDAQVSAAAGAGQAAVTAAANDAQGSVTVTPADATAAVTAYDATVSTSSSPTAQDAAVTATAYDATVSTSSNVQVPAQDAAVTAVSYDAAVSVTVTPADAAVSVTGLDAQASAGVNAGSGQGSATAFDALASVAPGAGAGDVVAAAYDPTAALGVNAASASAGATAYDATVQTSVPGTSAPAGQASAAATAYDASVAVTVNAQAATVSAAAFDAVGDTGIRYFEIVDSAGTALATADSVATVGSAAADLGPARPVGIVE